MPGKPTGKRLIPLASGDVRWLDARARYKLKKLGRVNTAWASCAVLDGVKGAFSSNPRDVAQGLVRGGGAVVSGKAVALTVMIGAAFVFAPLAATAGTMLIPTGQILSPYVGVATQPFGIGGLILTSLTGMNVANPTRTTFVNFNKPCKNPPRL